MKLWFSLPGNDRWLLIYDNVDNPRIPDNKDQEAYNIRSYFPEAHQGSIIVTTRWKTLRIGHPIEVAKLSREEESISLLDRSSNRAIGKGGFPTIILSKSTLTTRTDPKIKDLIKKLDGLPLALATAGGYLGLTGMPVSEYLDRYEDSWLELQRSSPSLLSYEDRAIYSTWNLSYMHIRKEDESAAKLLELWACFDNRDVWYDLLKAGEDEAPDWFLDVIRTKLAFKSVVGKLQKHALVESLTESDGFSMHHCVHAWVRSVLYAAIEGQNMRLALACIAESVPWDPVPGDWMIEQRLIPHAERCLRLLHAWKDESKNSEQIEDLVTTSFSSLGKLYKDQGKLTEAESMYQRALAGYEESLRPDHILTLHTVHNLGSLYHGQGKLTEAESMYQRALAGYNKNPPRGARSRLDLFYNMGLLCRALQNFDRAKGFFNQAYEGYQELWGSQHASTINALNQLNVEIERDTQGAERHKKAGRFFGKRLVLPTRPWRRK